MGFELAGGGGGGGAALTILDAIVDGDGSAGDAYYADLESAFADSRVSINVTANTTETGDVIPQSSVTHNVYINPNIEIDMVDQVFDSSGATGAYLRFHGLGPNCKVSLQRTTALTNCYFGKASLGATSGLYLDQVHVDFTGSTTTTRILLGTGECITRNSKITGANVSYSAGLLDTAMRHEHINLEIVGGGASCALMIAHSGAEDLVVNGLRVTGQYSTSSASPIIVAAPGAKFTAINSDVTTGSAWYQLAGEVTGFIDNASSGSNVWLVNDCVFTGGMGDTSPEEIKTLQITAGNQTQVSNLQITTFALSGSGGFTHSFTNCFFTAAVTTGNFDNVRWIGCDFNAAVTISSGAANNVFVGCQFGSTITDNGTDTIIRGSTPEGSNNLKRSIQVVAFEATTATATGDGAAYFVIPDTLGGKNLVEAHARVITAGSGGTSTTIQIHNVTDTADVLSTLLEVDGGGTSDDGNHVINTATDDAATDDLWRIDVDTVESTPAQGLIVSMTFQ